MSPTPPKPANTPWLHKIDDVLATLKAEVTAPGFTGFVGLEIHAGDGVIKDIVRTGKEHKRIR